MNKAKTTGVILIIFILSVLIWTLASPEVASFYIPLPIAIPAMFIIGIFTLWSVTLVISGSFTALILVIIDFMRD